MKVELLVHTSRHDAGSVVDVSPEQAARMEREGTGKIVEVEPEPKPQPKKK